MPRAPRYSYDEVRQNVRAHGDRGDHLLDGVAAFDFRKPFLPDALAGVWGLGLPAEDALRLNQIRAHGYVGLAALSEAITVPFVLDHARARVRTDVARLRALLDMASNEARHLMTFQRYQRAFVEGFGSPCRLVGPAEDITRVVLARHPLTIAILVLHVEAGAERHRDLVRASDEPIDLAFQALLRQHGSEGTTNLQLLINVGDELAESCSRAERALAVEGYLELVEYFDSVLGHQVELDLQSLREATGRRLDADVEWAVRGAQRRSQHAAFLGAAMRHPVFVELVGAIAPESRAHVEDRALRYA